MTMVRRSLYFVLAVGTAWLALGAPFEHGG